MSATFFIQRLQTFFLFSPRFFTFFNVFLIFISTFITSMIFRAFYGCGIGAGERRRWIISERFIDGLIDQRIYLSACQSLWGLVVLTCWPQRVWLAGRRMWRMRAGIGFKPTPALEVASRHRLRSANRHRLIVPRCRLNTYGRPRAFPVAGPTVWNSLQPDELRDPACDVDSFKQFFKTISCSFY